MSAAPGGAGHPVFTFDTTHHALWAEEVAGEEGIPCEVIPAPPELEAKCDLALKTLPDQVETLAKALGEQGIVFRLAEA